MGGAVDLDRMTVESAQCCNELETVIEEMNQAEQGRQLQAVQQRGENGNQHHASVRIAELEAKLRSTVLTTLRSTWAIVTQINETKQAVAKAQADRNGELEQIINTM